MELTYEIVKRKKKNTSLILQRYQLQAGDTIGVVWLFAKLNIATKDSVSRFISRDSYVARNPI